MNQNRTSEVTRLRQSLLAEIAPSFPDLTSDPDVLTQLLEDKRNPRTRHEYQKDLNDFFATVTGETPTRDLVLQFLHLSRHRAIALVLKYKAELFKRGLSEATVNRRLAAIKALVAMGRKLGVCDYSLEDIKGEKVQIYRDTSGVAPDIYKQVLAQCDLSTWSGKRDYALLKLLWGNALRRNEVSLLNVGDFDPNSRQIKILGKGKGTQLEVIDISRTTTSALLEWLRVRGTEGDDEPFFISLDFHNKGHRLTGVWLGKLPKRQSS